MTTGPTTEEAFIWSDKFILGYRPIDETHEEFVDLVRQMEGAADPDLPPLLALFAQHAKAHFDLENKLMVETEFPPRDCHIDEHAAVMKSIEEVLDLVNHGQYAYGRSLIDELIRWFPSHADHLDSALAHWMCKRSLGGKPVVLRRNLQLR
jgi:hemerythrin